MKKVTLNMIVLAALMFFGAPVFAQAPADQGLKTYTETGSESGDLGSEASSGCPYEDQRCVKYGPDTERQFNPANTVNYATCLARGNCAPGSSGSSTTGTN